MLSDDLFNKIFLSCKSVLARVVSRMVSPDDVEDIVQETYVRVYQFKSKGEIKNPQAVIIKTARNLALDHIKRAENRLNTSLDETDHNDALLSDRNPMIQSSINQEFYQLCEAVRQLPSQCRKIFVLKKVYGYSQREIAQKLRLSESTIEKQIAIGMKRCSAFIKQHHTNEGANNTIRKREHSNG